MRAAWLLAVLVGTGVPDAAPARQASPAVAPVSTAALQIADTLYVAAARKVLLEQAGSDKAGLLAQELAAQRATLARHSAVRLQQHFSERELKAGALLFGSDKGRSVLERHLLEERRAIRPGELDFLASWSQTPGASAFLRKFKALEPGTLMNGNYVRDQIAAGLARRMADHLETKATPPGA